LDGKSKEIKQNYERLHRLALNSHPKEFNEPKVEGIFKSTDVKADFDIVTLKKVLGLIL